MKMNNHKQSIHKEVGYVCDLCEYLATIEGNLRTHTKKHQSSNLAISVSMMQQQRMHLGSTYNMCSELVLTNVNIRREERMVLKHTYNLCMMVSSVHVILAIIRQQDQDI